MTIAGATVRIVLAAVAAALVLVVVVAAVASIVWRGRAGGNDYHRRISGQEIFGYVVLLLCFGYVGSLAHHQRLRIAELEEREPDTVRVYVDHGAVDLTELAGVFCHVPPPEGASLTTADP